MLKVQRIAAFAYAYNGHPMHLQLPIGIAQVFSNMLAIGQMSTALAVPVAATRTAAAAQRGSAGIYIAYTPLVTASPDDH